MRSKGELRERAKVGAISGEMAPNSILAGNGAPHGPEKTQKEDSKRQIPTNRAG